MQLHCPNCHAGILSDDVALDSGLAKCRRCSEVFSIRPQLEEAGVPLFDPARRGIKPTIAEPPPHFHVEEWGSEFTLWWRWISWEVLMLIFFGAFWNGILAVFYVALLSEMDWESWEKWLTLLFPSLHLIVGLAIIYAIVTSLVNWTTVQLSMGKLTVWNGPLPVGGNHYLEANELDQLYVALDENAEGRYALKAQLKDGAVVALLSNVQTPEGLLYLERKIEEQLRIVDRPMPDEVY
jgi:predicted Zn finger-like uncharacterized protein